MGLVKVAVRYVWYFFWVLIAVTIWLGAFGAGGIGQDIMGPTP